MTALILEMLGAIFRAGLIFLSGWFVQQGIWTPDQADRFSTATAVWLAAAAVAVAWSLWAKYRNRIKLLTALDAPAGTTVESLEKRIDHGMASKLPPIMLALALSLSLGASCAKVTPKLLAGEKTVRAVVLEATNKVEPIVCNAEARKVLTTKPCLQLLDALEPAVDLAIAYNRALREGKLPPIADTIAAFDRLIAAIRNVVPDGPEKTAALQDLAVARVRAEGGKS